MVMKTKKVHFSLGQNAGKLLYDIAIEKMLYDYKPEKAFETIEKSLIGIDRGLVKKILTGEYQLGVSSDGLSFNLQKKQLYNTYNLRDWYLQKMDALFDEANAFEKSVCYFDMHIQKHPEQVLIRFSWADVLQAAYNSDKEKQLRADVWDDFNEQLNLQHYQTVAATMYKVLKEIDDVISTCTFIYQEFQDIFSEEDHRYVPSVVFDAFKAFDCAMKRINDYGDSNDIKKHMDFIKNLEAVKIFRPVDITGGYDAGWLAPNGDYYGINGHISNNIHIEIADKLHESGIINPPKDVNADRYLEEDGWVRIHHNWILYDGYNLHHLGKKNKPLTSIQVEKLVQYGKICCDKTVLLLGFSKTPISAARFEMTDKYQLYKYFTF